jgi:hypothetical protein
VSGILSKTVGDTAASGSIGCEVLGAGHHAEPLKSSKKFVTLHVDRRRSNYAYPPALLHYNKGIVGTRFF